VQQSRLGVAVSLSLRLYGPGLIIARNTLATGPEWATTHQESPSDLFQCRKNPGVLRRQASLSGVSLRQRPYLQPASPTRAWQASKCLPRVAGPLVNGRRSTFKNPLRRPSFNREFRQGAQTGLLRGGFVRRLQNTAMVENLYLRRMSSNLLTDWSGFCPSPPCAGFGEHGRVESPSRCKQRSDGSTAHRGGTSVVQAGNVSDCG